MQLLVCDRNLRRDAWDALECLLYDYDTLAREEEYDGAADDDWLAGMIPR